MRRGWFVFLHICMCSLFPFVCHALVNAELVYQTQVTAGQSLSLKIPLTNDSDRDLLVNFYVTDFATTTKSILYETAPKTPRSNADWIRLSSQQVTIPPKDRIDFFYTIQVPQILPLKGSYWSMIMIEPVDLDQQKRQMQEGLNIFTKVRYGYLVITDFGSAKPKLKVLEKGIRQVEGENQLFVDVENKGERVIRPRLISELYKPNGAFVEKLDTIPHTVLPGNAVGYSIPLEKIEPGKYSSFILLDAGDDGVFGDRIQIDVPVIEKKAEAGAAPAETVSPSAPPVEKKTV